MNKIMMALAVLTAFAAVTPVEAQEKTKVCFVYLGSRTDGGWTQSHDMGRLQLEKAMGDRIETPFMESVPQGPDADSAIERMATSGCAMIVTTSFGFMDSTMRVAEKFPDVKFEHVTGLKNAENVSTFFARFYEGKYIQGQIAARMSKTGLAGYVATFPIPEVVMGINAFELGARSINPDFNVKVVWANTWVDPARAADAANRLIDEGVDVMTQHTDTTAPMQVAAQRGILAFGQTSDMIAAGPKSQLTSIVDTWGAYYIKRTQALLDGTWTAGRTWDGLKDGIITMAPYTNMPEDVKAMAEATEAKIRSGELHPFTGPINRQDGSVWLEEGETADDDMLLGMDFYIEGVDDELPR